MKLTATYLLPTSGPHTPHYRYFFNGQEADNEVYGNEVVLGYEFRQYDARIGRWWSIDPMADKYPGVSPYAFCNGSPVLLLDPNGAEVWKPEVDEKGNIYLKRQDNDDYLSLVDFFKGSGHVNSLFSKKQIKKMWDNQNEQGDVLLPRTNFSVAIKYALKNNYPDETKQYTANEILNTPTNYNCFGAALDGATGDWIGRHINDLDDELSYIGGPQRWHSTSEPVFGKTLIRFGTSNKAQHAAVYFGKDSNGDIYVFTKNGKYYGPTIMKLQDLMDKYGNIYGEISPMQTNIKELSGESGMYNFE